MNRNGRLLIITFPNPRETEPVLELEQRTSRTLASAQRWLELQAGVRYTTLY